MAGLIQHLLVAMNVLHCFSWFGVALVSTSVECPLPLPQHDCSYLVPGEPTNSCVWLLWDLFYFFCINFPCVMWYLYYYIRKMIAFAPDIPFSIILNFLCGFPPCYAYANGCSRQPQTGQEVIPMDGCTGRVFAQLTFGVKQWGNMPEAGGEMKNWRVWRTVVTQQVSKSFGNISSSDSSLQRGNKPLQPAVSAPDWLVGR